jgi:CubicO group peptidase (beta-lactamase class C family)
MPVSEDHHASDSLAGPVSAGRGSAEVLQSMDSAIRSGEFQKIGSVLVARGGSLVHEFYATGTGAATRRNTRSATKTVAGMLVGIAIDRGQIRGVHERVMSFFADRQPAADADPRKDEITLEDLLTMSSALQCNDDDDCSPGNEERMYVAGDWIQFALDIPVGPEPSAGRQARRFSYCTAGVALLGAVLVRATGQAVPDFAREVLFGPLGIEDAEWAFTPQGLAFTGGGLELRSADLLKLGQLCLNRGAWNGRQVISPAWVADSLRQHVVVDDQTGYGYLWWLRALRVGGNSFSGYLMQGNGGNKVCVIPELDATAVITSTNYSTPGMHQQTDRLLAEYVLPALVA